MATYKVHTAYVDNNGVVIPAGIYKDTEIDLAVARNKSVVTTVDSGYSVSITNNFIGMDTLDFSPTIKDSTKNIVPVVILDPISTTTKVDKIKINSISSEELQKQKFIGKVTADKVVEIRKTHPFTSYDQLDKSVPIKRKKWVDLFPIDFEVKDVMTFENSVQIHATN